MNIVITGASKGLGKAFALQFAKHTTLYCCVPEMKQRFLLLLLK
jgi:NAD(P)-dependent dehydrogenase (short-subunit alcohol dehydrogenase family)